MRRRVNLPRYCYLCLMSTNCLFEHARARPRACARWMQVGLTTLKGAWPRRPVRTLRPRPRPHLRPRPRVVYPVFCSNANGSRRVDVSTRTEPVGRAQQLEIRQMRDFRYVRATVAHWCRCKQHKFTWYSNLIRKEPNPISGGCPHIN